MSRLLFEATRDHLHAAARVAGVESAAFTDAEVEEALLATSPIAAALERHVAEAEAARRALESRLAAMLRRLEASEARLADLASRPPEVHFSAPDPSPTLADRLSAVEGRFAELASRLSDLAARTTEVHVAAPPPADVTVNAPVTVQPAEVTVIDPGVRKVEIIRNPAREMTGAVVKPEGKG